MASTLSAQWPPKEGLSTQVTARKDAVLTVAASTRIQAPAALVFEVVRGIESYEKWNSFCPKVDLHSQPEAFTDDTRLNVGTAFTFHAIMDSSKPNKAFATHLKVTDISTPERPSSYIPAAILDNDGTYTAALDKVYRISWSSAAGLMEYGLRTERFHEVVIVGDYECEVRTWEVMGGVAARVVKWMYQKTLNDKFKLWCDDLKKTCEERVMDNDETGS